MRVLDRILAGERVVALHPCPKPPIEAVRAAQPIDVDNVAEYIFRNTKVGDSWEIASDFPNIAPPFELAWFEYRRPPTIRSLRMDMKPDDDGALPDHVGVLAEAQRVDEGWTTTFYVFTQSGKEPVMGPLTYHFDCDAEGAVVGGPGAAGAQLTYPDDEVAATLWLIADFLVPVLMATSLLHAKNVTIEREPPIDGPLQRAHRKRYGVERVRFHRLHIEPMRRVLRDAGAEAPDTGVRQAMHLVRGHFKDYRDGRGLFGRYRGLFWWDQHVAGRPEEGFATKEYVVHAPHGRGSK